MITRVKIVNHKILPDVEFNLNSTIVRVVGYNGAGKSFLLSLLSPYPNISGYGSAYPIKENESGLLEIDMMYKNKKFTMITEYTPNSRGTHSAKCYLNMIDENGAETALNPTGNVESYKAVISEYLDYNKDVDLISYLNQKSCGIISAAPEERLRLFKILIREQIAQLTKYYKNVSDKFTYNSAMLKGREKEFARMRSKEELHQMHVDANNRITSIQSSLRETEIRIAELQENMGALKAEFNRVADIDIMELNAAKQCLSMSPKKNVDEYCRDKQNLKDNLNHLVNEMMTINSELSAINLTDAGMSRDSIEKQIKEIKTAIMAYDSIIEIPNTVSLGMLIGKLTALNEGLSDNADGVYSVLSEYDSSLSLDSILENISDTRKSLLLEKSNLKINETKDFAFAMFEYLPETEACNTCILRNEFEKYAKAYYENKETYERIEVINKSIQSLDEKQDILRAIGSHIGKYEDCVYLINNESVDKVKEACIEIHDRLYVFSSKNYLSGLIKKLTVYKTNADYMNNMRAQLAKLNEMKNNSASSQILDKYESCSKRLTYLREEKESIEHLLNNAYLIDITVSDNVRYLTLEEINKILTSKYKLKTDIDNLTNTIKSIENKREVMANNIAENKKELYRIGVETANVNSMSGIISDLSVTVKELHMIRAVLSKHIPIEILKGITDNIRDNTNDLLTTAGIDITIDIEANDNSIIIPVTVRESVTPEAKFASSGETALLGLALNSTIKNKVNYPILKLDEIDANLDIKYAEQYLTMVDAILQSTNTTQIFMISHRLSGTNIGEVLVLGDYDMEELGDIDKSKIIKVY